MKYSTDPKFILDGHSLIPIDTSTQEDLLRWVFRMSETDCRVEQTAISGKVRVSTVFLGVNHNFFFEPIRIHLRKDWMSDNYHRRIQKKWFKQDTLTNPALLFETMVFTDEKAGACIRTSSWKEAQKAHDVMVREVIATHEQRRQFFPEQDPNQNDCVSP